jgi:hypothetical protein
LLAPRKSGCPTHKGAFVVAVGAAGVSFTVTLTIAAVLVHPAVVTNTEYEPVASVEAPVTVGFCVVEVKLFGPIQLYDKPVELVAPRFRF